MLSFKEYLVLLEDKIDFLKNQYRDKLSTEHDQFAEHKGSDAIIDHLSTASKTYLPWVVKQYQQGKIKQEDVPQIRDTLELFDKHKRNLEKKDINGYDNIGEIRTALKPLIGSAATIKEREQHEADVNHQLIHEEPGFKVYHTRSKTASQNFYGGGTKIGKTDWCTASRGMQNKFDEYNSQGNLYQIHIKNPDGTESLYQYHPSSDGQFKDARDEDVDMSQFIKDYPQMKNVKAFKGSHDALPLSHEELTQMIQDGSYTTDHLKHIKEDQMHLMSEALAKKIQSGTYRSHDLKHAEDNGYLSDDHLESLPEGLMKKIRNGTYDSWDLKHSKDNNYLNDDHIEALKHAYTKKLKNNDHGLSEIDMAKQYGYFIPQHGTKIQSNTVKYFKKRGVDDFDNISDEIDKLYEHELFNDDHRKELKKQLIDELNKGKFDIDRINYAQYDGHYDNEVQEASKKLLIDNLNKGIFDYGHSQHATEKGYFNDEAKEASRKILMDDRKRGVFDTLHEKHAKENGYYHSPEQQREKTNIINLLANVSGENDSVIPHTNRAVQLGIFDDDIRKAATEAVLRTMQKRYFNVNNLEDARVKNYLQGPVKDASLKRLSNDYIDADLRDRGIKHFVLSHIDFAKEHDYCPKTPGIDRFCDRYGYFTKDQLLSRLRFHERFHPFSNLNYIVQRGHNYLAKHGLIDDEVEDALRKHYNSLITSSRDQNDIKWANGRIAMLDSARKK